MIDRQRNKHGAADDSYSHDNIRRSFLAPFSRPPTLALLYYLLLRNKSNRTEVTCSDL